MAYGSIWNLFLIGHQRISICNKTTFSLLEQKKRNIEKNILYDDSLTLWIGRERFKKKCFSVSENN